MCGNFNGDAADDIVIDQTWLTAETGDDCPIGTSGITPPIISACESSYLDQSRCLLLSDHEFFEQCNDGDVGINAVNRNVTFPTFFSITNLYYNVKFQLYKLLIFEKSNVLSRY